MLEVMRSKALLPLIDRRALVFLKKHLRIHSDRNDVLR
jgi:hypothetical protein